MIERGLASYAGVQIDSGFPRWSASLDDPNTPNDGTSHRRRCGGVRHRRSSGSGRRTRHRACHLVWSRWKQPLRGFPNWYGSNPPDAGRGWLVSDPMLNVELPDSSVRVGPRCSTPPPSGNVTSSRRCRHSLLQVPENDTLAFRSGIYLGLVFPSISLDEAVPSSRTSSRRAVRGSC